VIEFALKPATAATDDTVVIRMITLRDADVVGCVRERHAGRTV